MSNSLNAPTPQAAASAENFVDSIGINTAMGASATGYSNISQVEYDLAYLGVQNERDAYRGPDDAYTFQQIASQLGVSFDFYIAPGEYGMDRQIAQIEANPGIVKFVEGANESDLTPQTYDGLTGMAATQAEQAALYTAIHGDTALNGNGRVTPVIQASFALAASFSAAGNMGTNSDYGNTHEYFMNGAPPGPNIGDYISLAQQVSPGQPIIASEGGYYTMPSTSGVDETVQAKYDLNLVFDDWQAGIKMTYLYELLDEGSDPSNSNSLMHFGLFDSNGNAKPAATALHNLIATLNDPGGSSAGGTLSYAVTGLPSTGHDLLMAKANGTFVLAFWNDVQLWDPSTASEIVSPPVPITLSLGQAFQSVQIYDPLVGTLPVASYSNTSQVSLNLLDHPILVEISPTAPAQLSLVQPTLTQEVQSNQPSANLWSLVMANVDETINAYMPNLSISSVNTLGTSGTVSLNAATQALSYTPAAYNPFATLDKFSYTVTDSNGGTASGTLDVLIAPPANATYGMIAGDTYTAPASGWTLYSEAGAQTLVGSSTGGDTFVGGGDTMINAYGTGNVISATQGNHTVVTGFGGASVTLADGDNTISGTGSNNSIVSGNGNSVISGLAGNTSVTLGNGNQQVSLTGSGNSVTTGVGTSTISPGSGGDKSVVVAGGTNDVMVGGTGNLIQINGGTNQIDSSTGQSTFVLNAGSNTLDAEGTGNTVVGGSGATNVAASAGGSIISLGDGNADLQLGGAGNTIAVGNGNNIIVAGTGGGEIVTTGTGSNQITVGGLNDEIEVGGGTNSIVSQTGQAIIVLTAGNNTVDAEGTGNAVLGGSGSTTLVGPAGNSWIDLSSGQNNVQFSGTGNTVLLYGGTSTIGAGDNGQTTVLATAGTNQVVLGGSQNLVFVTGGTNTVSTTAGQSDFIATGGTNVMNIEGDGNTVIGGDLNDTITIAGTGNVVVAGSGAETINFIDSGNTVVVGPGADAFYDSSAGGNTVVLAAAGGQVAQIYGAVTTNGDEFDLRGLLAATSWNGDTTTLGDFLSLTSNGVDAVLSVNPSGLPAGSFQAVADLHASGPVAMADFLTRAIV